MSPRIVFHFLLMFSIIVQRPDDDVDVTCFLPYFCSREGKASLFKNEMSSFRKGKKEESASWRAEALFWVQKINIVMYLMCSMA